jgi:hypothetical protein
MSEELLGLERNCPTIAKDISHDWGSLTRYYYDLCENFWMYKVKSWHSGRLRWITHRHTTKPWSRNNWHFLVNRFAIHAIRPEEMISLMVSDSLSLWQDGSTDWLTDWLTGWATPFNWLVLKKQLIAHLHKKFYKFYLTRNFTPTSSWAIHCSLYWKEVNSDHITLSYLYKIKCKTVKLSP